jgi:sulfite exporter TauE/SafE
MELTLVLTAFLMGLAGAPHCAAMCGPSCAAVLGTCGARPGALGALAASTVTFHAFRVTSYALAGAVAATGVGLLAWAGQAAPWVRPLWTMLHVAALALGLWLAITGQQPAFMAKVGKTRVNPPAPERVQVVPGASLALPLRRSFAAGPLAAASAGSLWVIWPCGLLQSALVVSGLANTPLAGAGVMAAFAVAGALSIAAIFLFKNRVLQMRLAVFSTIAAFVGSILTVILFMQEGLNKSKEAIDDGLGLYMAIAALVFTLLAYRFVNKDEKLVRSADRLR